jgi:hypothetical protein
VENSKPPYPLSLDTAYMGIEFAEPPYNMIFFGNLCEPIFVHINRVVVTSLPLSRGNDFLILPKQRMLNGCVKLFAM